MSDDALRRVLLPTHFTGSVVAGSGSIAFPAVDCSTPGGHDSVKHVRYRQAGAEVETTGRKPYSCKLKVALFNDLRGWTDLFPTRYRELLEAFERNPYGLLQHPTRGLMDVHVDDWAEQLEGRTRSGLWLDVAFTEQLAESEVLVQGTAPTDPATDALAAAATADAAATALGVPAAGGVTTLVGDALATLEEVPRGYLEADGVLGAALGQLTARLGLADVGGVEGHAYRAAVEQARVALLAYRDAYLGTATPRTYTLPTVMSLAEVAFAVYSDPTRARDLAAANAVPDPVEVPAGTVLVVPE